LCSNDLGITSVMSHGQMLVMARLLLVNSLVSDITTSDIVQFHPRKNA